MNETLMNSSSQEDLPQIKFESHEMRSFYSMWVDYLMFPEQTKKALESFENRDIDALLRAIPQEKKTFAHVTSMEAEITKRGINNLGELKELLTEQFEKNDAISIGNAFETAYPAYHLFYEKNKANIEKNLTALREHQQNPEQGYQQELNAIYTLFDVPRENTCTCYLSPFPQQIPSTGRANPKGKTSSLSYSVEQNESVENYVENSDILIRKSSTPLHETTHSLFFESSLKKELDQGGSSADMEAVVKTLSDFFEKNPQEKVQENATSRESAVSALNESFAVCSTALLNEKMSGSPVKEGDKWYHGFEAANKLAPAMYPIFKEYIQENKKIDNQFFKRLSQNMENSKVKPSLHQGILALSQKTSSDISEVVKRKKEQLTR